MKTLPSILSGLAATGALFAFGSASAMPVYSASVNAELTLDEVTGSEDFEAFWTLVDSFQEDDAEGGASASASEVSTPTEPSSFDEGTSKLTTVLLADGQAPGIGSAGSAAGSDGVVELFNNSVTNTATFNFTLDYDVLASASVDDPLNQNAGSLAFLGVFSSQDFDPLLEIDAFVDTDEAPDPFEAVGQLVFKVVVAPEGEASVDLSAFVAGGVFSDVETDPIPVPPAALLFGSCLAAAGLRRLCKG